jgi:Domain of unknown function (DUF1772)
MITLSILFAALSLLATGVIYGTDVFSALVLRPAMAALDDATLTQAAGRVHEYGDRRLPLPGATGILAAALSAVFAALAGDPEVAALGGVAVVALLVWLALYLRVAAPINRQLTAAARAHVTPPNARAQQRRWDGVINVRAALQGVALVLLLVVMATV